MDRHQDVSPVLAWQMKWYTQVNKSDSGDTID